MILQKQIADQGPTLAGTSRSPAVTANSPQPAPKERDPAPAQMTLERPKGNSPTRAEGPTAPQLIPEMASVPGVEGLLPGGDDDSSEKPIHRVTIKPFAISKFPVTVREWKACVAAKSCAYVPTGKDDVPVSNLSWADAQQFVEWLAKVTQKPFRLPSEAEWEYAARGGSRSKYWWGDQLQADIANCKGCNEPYDASQPLKVGSFKPNSFGLYDMGGNVHLWVYPVAGIRGIQARLRMNRRWAIMYSPVARHPIRILEERSQLRSPCQPRSLRYQRTLSDARLTCCTFFMKNGHFGGSRRESLPTADPGSGHHNVRTLPSLRQNLRPNYRRTGLVVSVQIRSSR